MAQEELFECPVRNEMYPLSETYVLSCNHRFSRDFLGDFFAHGTYTKTCPLCRRAIAMGDLEKFGVQWTWNTLNTYVIAWWNALCVKYQYQINLIYSMFVVMYWCFWLGSMWLVILSFSLVIHYKLQQDL